MHRFPASFGNPWGSSLMISSSILTAASVQASGHRLEALDTSELNNIKCCNRLVVVRENYRAVHRPRRPVCSASTNITTLTKTKWDRLHCLVM
ncbi:hypothetical protein F4782DRAFT_494742 [Xylaria castorea]|nr:hypothetical protein F4782DRAFT_494742 [Xylaria castorea]